jgi:hypothetical protein
MGVNGCVVGFGREPLAPHLPPKAQIIRNCAIFLSKLAQFDKLRQNCATPNLKLRQHHHVVHH